MSGKFEPKTPVQLDPPKDDPISVEDLAKADGEYTRNKSAPSRWTRVALGRLVPVDRLRRERRLPLNDACAHHLSQ